MHDTTLLQLIEDDIAPMQELLDLLHKEAIALHGRTVAQAVVWLLEQQYVERDGDRHRFFAGCFGIFGHGNVAGVGQALQQYDTLAVLLDRELGVDPEPATRELIGAIRDGRFPTTTQPLEA